MNKNKKILLGVVAGLVVLGVAGIAIFGGSMGNYFSGNAYRVSRSNIVKQPIMKTIEKVDSNVISIPTISMPIVPLEIAPESGSSTQPVAPDTTAPETTTTQPPSTTTDSTTSIPVTSEPSSPAPIIEAAPQISLSPVPTGGMIYGDIQMPLMGINISAPVDGSVMMSPAYSNGMTFSTMGSGLAPQGSGFCALYDVNANNKLASANIAPTMSFTFGTKASDDNSGVPVGVPNYAYPVSAGTVQGIPASPVGMMVNPGTTSRVELRCTTVSVPAGSSLAIRFDGMTYGSANSTLNNSVLPMFGPKFTSVD